MGLEASPEFQLHEPETPPTGCVQEFDDFKNTFHTSNFDQDCSQVGGRIFDSRDVRLAHVYDPVGDLNHSDDARGCAERIHATPNIPTKELLER